MPLLAIQRPALTGTAITYAAAASSQTFSNTGKEMLIVKNGDASPHTVTVAAQHPCSFGVSNAAHDSVTTVAAGEERAIGPFDPAQFNDANQQAEITWSATTSMTVAVIAK